MNVTRACQRVSTFKAAEPHTEPETPRFASHKIMHMTTTCIREHLRMVERMHAARDDSPNHHQNL